MGGHQHPTRFGSAREREGTWGSPFCSAVDGKMLIIIIIIIPPHILWGSHATSAAAAVALNIAPLLFNYCFPVNIAPQKPPPPRRLLFRSAASPRESVKSAALGMANAGTSAQSSNRSVAVFIR